MEQQNITNLSLLAEKGLTNGQFKLRNNFLENVDFVMPEALIMQ